MKKLIYVLLTIILIVSVTAVPAQAADGTVTLAVTPDKTTALQGDTVTFTFSLSNPSQVPIYTVGFTVTLPSGLTAAGSQLLCKDIFTMHNYSANGVFTALGMDDVYGTTAKTIDLLTLTCTVDKDAALGSKTLGVSGLKIAPGGGATGTETHPSAASVSPVEVAHYPHTWDNGTQTKAPTCAAEGVKTYTCTVCGEEKTESIPATGSHTWDTGEQTKAPTCTDQGETTYTCTVCGEERTESIPAAGHDAGAWVTTKEATCGEAGVETLQCTKCGASLGQTRDVPATGKHTWGQGKITTPATCTVPGVRTFTCGVCGATTTQSIPAPGHSWDSGKTTKEPTCTDQGVKTTTCTACGEEKTESIPATGHDAGAWVTTKEATCGEAGVETLQCTKCGASLGQTRDVPATGKHTWDSGKTTDPTCTEPGETIYTCTVCGEEKTESIPAAGHDAGAWVTTKEATCGEAGVETLQCTKCGASLGQTRDVPATGKHTWDTGEQTKAPTCTDQGETTYTCTVCGETRTESIPATGHQPGQDAQRQEPTCEQDGWVSYTCPVCGVEVERQTLPATGHQWDSGEQTKAPTCTDQGETTYTCPVCGETKTESIPATGHDAGAWVTTKEATCGEAGVETLQCTKCGASLGQTRDVPATGKHTWDDGKTTKEPTCTDPGVKTTTCTVCGEEKTEPIPATGHQWDDGKTTDPTCTEPGETVYTCTVCGETKTESIPATGHKPGQDAQRQEPTCEQDGWVSYTCSVCGVEVERQTLPATGHQWDGGKQTKAPTCTDQGETTYTCTVCGKTRTASIPATGHDAGAWVTTKEATCGEAGVETLQCTKCGASLGQTRDVPATGKHTWDGGKTTDPTCTEPGETVYTCTVCGETNTESIPAAGHKPGQDAQRQEPTCEQDGWVSYTCTVCGVEVERQTLPATGHRWGEPAFTWNAHEAAATRVCENDPAHTQTAAVTVTAQTVPAACEEPGSVTYTATAVFDGDDNTYTSTDEAVDTLEPTGHRWGEPSFTWSAHEAAATRVCENDPTHTQTAAVTVAAQTVPAACEEPGSVTYTATATFDGDDNTYTSTDEAVDTLEPTGHQWSAQGEVTQPPTYTEPGVLTFTCENDPTHTKEESIPALEPDVTVTPPDPTCVEESAAKKLEGVVPGLVEAALRGEKPADMPESVYEALQKAGAGTGELSVSTELTVTPTAAEGAAAAYDITVTITVTGTAADGSAVSAQGSLTRLPEAIRFHFPKPDAGPIFKVLHLTDGGAEAVAFAVEGDEIVFSADRFSTYAIMSSADLADAAVEAIPDQTYTGKEIKPAVKLTINGGETLTEGTDYTVTYADNTAVGTATVTVTGMGRFAGSEITVSFAIKAAPTPAPTATKAPGSPHTGDETPIALYAGLLTLCAGALAMALIRRRKSR